MIEEAAKGTADITALVERGRTALAESRAVNPSGVFAHPTQVHWDLVRAHEAIGAALAVSSATYWPVARDYPPLKLV